MESLDNFSKILGALSTVVAIWLGYLQIRELYRKRSMRSGVMYRNGKLIAHDFSLSHNWQIWLCAASILIGLIFIGRGLYENHNLFVFYGAAFIVAAIALTYSIARSRERVEEKQRFLYEQRRANLQQKKKAKTRKRRLPAREPNRPSMNK